MVEINESYKLLINKHAPHSPTLKNCFFAFLVGGFLCLVGEGVASLFIRLGCAEDKARLYVTLIYIAAASLATSLGFFDKIARHGGAGTLLPVTGFSNSISSAAIDSRSEGYILGVGAKIFTVAGPVILYSTLGGTLFGLIYYLYNYFSGGI